MLTINDLDNFNKDDNFIYHYTNYNVAIENILSSNTLLFNKVRKMNDPLEFENFIHAASWNNEIPGEERTKLLNIGRESNNIVKNKIKICCFCVDTDISEHIDYIHCINKGYSRSRMWSQYANGHRGICLIFNRVKLLEIIKGKYENIFSEEIKYRNNLFNIFNFQDIEYEIARNMDAWEWVKRHKHEYLFYKVDDYKSEQEYRIAVYSDNDDDNILIDFEDSLEGVILGVRFPDVYKVNIKNVMEAQNIPVFQIDWFYGKPSLDIISK